MRQRRFWYAAAGMVSAGASEAADARKTIERTSRVCITLHPASGTRDEHTEIRLRLDAIAVAVAMADAVAVAVAVAAGDAAALVAVAVAIAFLGEHLLVALGAVHPRYL